MNEYCNIKNKLNNPRTNQNMMLPNEDAHLPLYYSVFFFRYSLPVSHRKKRLSPLHMPCNTSRNKPTLLNFGLCSFLYTDL